MKEESGGKKVDQFWDIIYVRENLVFDSLNVLYTGMYYYMYCRYMYDVLYTDMYLSFV